MSGGSNGRMSLRQRLVVLLGALAVFAVATAAATVYGIQWNVQSAVHKFEHTLDQAMQIDRVRIALREQTLYLRDLLAGRTDVTRDYFAARDAFATGLRQLAQFVPESASAPPWPDILRLVRLMEEESDRCLTLLQEDRSAEATAVLSGRLEGELLPELESRLMTARTRLDEARNRAARELRTTSVQVLILTVLVAALAGVMVLVGAALIRRWLIVPLDGLHEATQRFREGDLTYRVHTAPDDELGRLGLALNDMAGSVARAQAELIASETKYRWLFRNLRDAVVICDAEGRIVEFHDSDTELLGVEGTEHVGRPLHEVWPEWRAIYHDWPALIADIVGGGRRYRAVEVGLVRAHQTEPEVFVDVLVYRVEYGEARRAAIVLRDVTDRHRLQRRLHRAETMEAVGTLAGGLAHDFNNLLAGVIGTLSMLASEMGQSSQAERLRTALRACWQAAGLSRRLLNFAGSAHGEPQVFSVVDALDLIMQSLDPSFVEGIRLHKKLAGAGFEQHAPEDAAPDRSGGSSDLVVRMDRDQFTQVVLNLLRNARDAMPDGGTLTIEADTVTARDPDEGTPERPYVRLTVRDTGSGMSPEVRQRIFEPFFTTKSRTTRRGRGMGLAIVYSVVKNAGGFVQVESAPGAGTTFHVYLPVSQGLPEPAPSAQVRKPISATRGTLLLVEQEPVLREVLQDALRSWGYLVLSADDADEACAHLRGTGVVELAVVDVSGGDEAVGLMASLQAIDPALRFLLMTSTTARALPAALERFVAGRLSKPFPPEALADAVASALHAGAKSSRPNP